MVTGSSLQPPARHPPAGDASPAGPVLLRTKLRPPPVRAGLIPRARLAKLLEAGAQGRLCLIDASAGSGKTTLLAQWCLADQASRRIARLSLPANVHLCGGHPGRPAAAPGPAARQRRADRAADRRPGVHRRRGHHPLEPVHGPGADRPTDAAAVGVDRGLGGRAGPGAAPPSRCRRDCIRCRSRPPWCAPSTPSTTSPDPSEPHARPWRPPTRGPRGRTGREPPRSDAACTCPGRPPRHRRCWRTSRAMGRRQTGSRSW
jgi:hypothetical protein